MNLDVGEPKASPSEPPGRPCFRAMARYLAFVVRGGDVHLLLHHVVNVGSGAALDPFFLLPLKLVSHHLDSLRPLISEHRFKQLYRPTSGEPHLQPTVSYTEDN